MCSKLSEIGRGHIDIIENTGFIHLSVEMLRTRLVSWVASTSINK